MYVTSHSEEPDAVPFFAQASLRMTAITLEVFNRRYTSIILRIRCTNALDFPAGDEHSIAITLHVSNR